MRSTNSLSTRFRIPQLKKLIEGVRRFLTVRGARKKGAAAGARWAKQVEENWVRLKEHAQANYEDPATLKAMFLGWMRALHADAKEMLIAVKTSEAEFQHLWSIMATTFVARFRSEVIDAGDVHRADDILSEQDIVRIIADVDGEVEQLLGRLERDREEALDGAVKAVRAAEEAGRAGVDPRSDKELKESIREMWDRDFGVGTSKRGLLAKQ